jgi:hypothetical protein
MHAEIIPSKDGPRSATNHRFPGQATGEAASKGGTRMSANGPIDILIKDA